MINEAYNWLYFIVCIVLACFLFVCLVRAIKGPRIGDRLVAVNMMGTMIMVMICVVAFMLNEDYLIDVAIVYAVLSFLANVLLCKVYIGIHVEKQMEKNDKKEEKADA